MTLSLEEVLQSLPEEWRGRIEQRTSELIAEELHHRDLRRLRKLTQTRPSRKLKIQPEGISRIEKRTDLYLCTLRSYVEGVGGKLSLVVEFADRPPVILAGLGESATRKPAPKKARSGAKSRSKFKSKSRPAV